MHFNWFTYSVVIGILQKEDPMAGISKQEESDLPERGNLAFSESVRPLYSNARGKWGATGIQWGESALTGERKMCRERKRIQNDFG